SITLRAYGVARSLSPPPQAAGAAGKDGPHVTYSAGAALTRRPGTTAWPAPNEGRRARRARAHGRAVRRRVLAAGQIPVAAVRAGRRRGRHGRRAGGLVRGDRAVPPPAGPSDPPHGDH